MSLPRQYAQAIISFTFVIILLGIWASSQLPNALLPEVSRPEIGLQTIWAGKTAVEIDQTLIDPLENQLHGLKSLKELKSWVINGKAWTSLIFHPGTDMKQTYIDLLSKVNQVPNWPAEVSSPVIYNFSDRAVGTAGSFFFYGKEDVSQAQLINAFKAHIEPQLSQIDGIVEISTADTPLDERVDIEFDAQQLAKNGLTIDKVYEKLNSMTDKSGNNMTLGSREYEVFFSGNIPLTELQDLPIIENGGRIVRLGEVANIHKRIATDWDYAAVNGHHSLYFSVFPSKDVNLLQIIEQLKTLTNDLNQGILAELGMEIQISRDDSVAIQSALINVYGSLLLGVLLAMSVVFYYLRNWRLLLLVFISVPVCLSFVILFMYLGGYSLNVISLAGMALSVGLLLDASIVVVENIQRLRAQGKDLSSSITQGVSEVKGALFASTISSIVIFLPVLMMRSTEGQLFDDLAFTISGALLASLFVALVLIPATARYILTARENVTVVDKIDRWSEWFSAPSRSRKMAVVVLILGIPAAMIATYYAMPNQDLLPSPKRQMVSSVLEFEEPLSVKVIEKSFAPLISQRIESQKAQGLSPDFRLYGMFCYQSHCEVYFYVDGELDFDGFEQWLNNNVYHDLVGVGSFSYQGSLLEVAIPNHRSSYLDLKGENLALLQKQGHALMASLRETFKDAQIEEDTPLDNGAARIEFKPNQDMLVHLGISNNELNRILVALTDGIYIGEFHTGIQTLPFFLKGQESHHIDELLQTEVLIEGHGLVVLRDIVDAKIVLAPQLIFRTERERSISLGLTPPEGEPMGMFVDKIKAHVSTFLQLPGNESLFVHYRGSADQLKVFLSDFWKIFLFALIILTLLMWLTLKSFRLASAVILSIPLAISGGMLNLKLLDSFAVHNLDVITMIGFVILMGLVINNAILLASQYQVGMVRGDTQQQAIREAVRLRKRPIYMSTGTTVLGMLPLMFNFGNGGEIYSGLAAVIVGGMVFSALFSLLFMSALLSMPWFDHRSNTEEVSIEQAAA